MKKLLVLMLGFGLAACDAPADPDVPEEPVDPVATEPAPRSPVWLPAPADTADTREG